MPMRLKPEHVTVIGKIRYKGADPFDAEADVVVISITAKGVKKHADGTMRDALALRFPTKKSINRLIRRPDDEIDPCERDLMDEEVKKLVTNGHLYALGHWVEQTFEGVKVVYHEGDPDDERWTFSYGYGTTDEGMNYDRYIFMHPTSETVDTGDIGKHMRFLFEKQGFFFTLTAGPEGLRIDDEDDVELDEDA